MLESFSLLFTSLMFTYIAGEIIMSCFVEQRLPRSVTQQPVRVADKPFADIALEQQIMPQ